MSNREKTTNLSAWKNKYKRKRGNRDSRNPRWRQSNRMYLNGTQNSECHLCLRGSLSFYEQAGFYLRISNTFENLSLEPLFLSPNITWQLVLNQQKNVIFSTSKWDLSCSTNEQDNDDFKGLIESNHSSVTFHQRENPQAVDTSLHQLRSTPLTLATQRLFQLSLSPQSRASLPDLGGTKGIETKQTATEVNAAESWRESPATRGKRLDCSVAQADFVP